MRNLKERDYLEDTGVVGRTILRWIFRKWNAVGMDQASDRARWQALVNTVINLLVL